MAFRPKAPVSFSKYLTRSIAHGKGDCRTVHSHSSAAQVSNVAFSTALDSNDAECTDAPADSKLVATLVCLAPFLFRFRGRLGRKDEYLAAESLSNDVNQPFAQK